MTLFLQKFRINNDEDLEHNSLRSTHISGMAEGILFEFGVWPPLHEG